MKLINLSLIASLAVWSSLVTADGLESAQKIQQRTHSAGAASQQRIDSKAEQALELQAEIESLRQQINDLALYRDHLSALIANQQVEQESLNQQRRQVSQTKQGLVPLMYHMLQALKLWVESDIPFNSAVREARIDKLEAMMTRADISDAEKFRRIFEAYQIELEYGLKLGQFEQSIDVDGVRRQVEVLQVGRLSLLARTNSQSDYWSWDRSKKAWVAVEPRLYQEIDKAYQVAAQQATPQLLTLPVSLKQREATQ
ncbi:DUF3450 domain-containing protein [Vibrio sinaloensis]|uniref:DUF3450 domain-containing protein n=1 Tax=Photobacterium sp. (strain ATCC 43367) TaxID=379097 RepID=UPI0020617FE0|nr:DUF3450 domain-containing protein [Vibrio sinaloensis]UPQ89104.1 DUF3450 domain-containing protein [Vibrio sinaloensis]